MQMTPHFECMYYFDQTGNSDAVTKAIDDAVTIGENTGMPGVEISRVHGKVKEQQQEKVLTQAIQFAEARQTEVEKLSLLPPPPTIDEESRAWELLYADQCNNL